MIGDPDVEDPSLGDDRYVHAPVIAADEETTNRNSTQLDSGKRVEPQTPFFGSSSGAILIMDAIDAKNDVVGQEKPSHWDSLGRPCFWRAESVRIFLAFIAQSLTIRCKCSG
jgi:hypothetical protein